MASLTVSDAPKATANNTGATWSRLPTKIREQILYTFLCTNTQIKHTLILSNVSYTFSQDLHEPIKRMILKTTTGKQHLKSKADEVKIREPACGNPDFVGMSPLEIKDRAVYFTVEYSGASNTPELVEVINRNLLQAYLLLMLGVDELGTWLKVFGFLREMVEKQRRLRAITGRA